MGGDPQNAELITTDPAMIHHPLTTMGSSPTQTTPSASQTADPAHPDANRDEVLEAAQTCVKKVSTAPATTASHSIVTPPSSSDQANRRASEGEQRSKAAEEALPGQIKRAIDEYQQSEEFRMEAKAAESHR
ncbi:hypothetical protein LIER_30131 [Lithospermum erythrorhizon]|uniref:Uncharacterized protein n=1 Tax=Lithospermum erythrorhizon TaxID=34254 RepID=A0AAV3RNA5_LITER